MEKPDPITFDKCPACGSTRRIAGMEIQSQIDKGRANPNTQAWLFNHQSMIADMSRTHLQVPIILSFYDVCVDCGTVYCIRVEKGMATPKVNMPQQGPGFSLS